MAACLAGSPWSATSARATTPATVSGSATVANSCTTTLNPPVQPSGSAPVSATFSSDASPEPHHGSPITLSTTNLSATFPAALLQAGVDSGLVSDGLEIPATFSPVLNGSNTVEATHTYSASSTITLHVIGGVAQPLTAAMTLPDTTWHPINSALPVVVTEQSLQAVLSLDLSTLIITATFQCTPNTTATIVKVDGAGASAWSITPSPSPPGPPNIDLADVSCVSTTSCVAVGNSGNGPVVESWNGSTWAIVPSPTFAPSSGASLNGVSCVRATNCYAVGSTYARTLIEHWDGSRWSTVSSPSPAAPFVGELSGVSCASASDCFAVGDSIAFTPTDLVIKTLVEHWNGSSWSIVASPNATGSIFSALSAVSCPTTTSCSAVGGSDNGNLAEHWDGSRWSIVTAPNGPFPFAQSASLSIGFSPGLNGVSCPTATGCYAVGETFDGPLVEHWNGVRWGIVSRLTPAGATFAQLDAVSCPGRRHCIAVGTYSTDPEGATTHELIARWNGTNWALMASPDLPSLFGFGGLTGVSCTTAGDCSAVGGSHRVDRWNGASWSLAPFASSNSSQSQLTQVSCPSATNCYAVGSYLTGTTGKTLVEHWNGSTWSIVTTPNPSGAIDASFSGVSCPGANNCYAVGSYDNSTTGKTLVEHWNGSTWSIVATPSPSGATYASLSGVSCPSATSCFAVGSYSTATTDKTFVQRWNGSSWSIVATPIPSGALFENLAGVTCTSPASCYAVGGYVSNSTAGFTFGTLVEYWNGTSWSIVSSPNPSSPSFAALTGVACSSATDCEAVGFYAPNSGSSLTGKALVEHWDGTSWSIVATPNPNGATDTGLRDVSCPSATNCYAVGSYSTTTATKTLVEHWDGSTWAIEATPNPSGSNEAVLSGVSCPGPTTCFAVGAFSANASVYTLTESST